MFIRNYCPIDFVGMSDQIVAITGQGTTRITNKEHLHLIFMEVFVKTKKKKARRSDHKIMTKEASVLKHLREIRKLSIRKAAKVIDLSDTKLKHAENGRCDLDPKLILKVLNGLGYSYEEL